MFASTTRFAEFVSLVPPVSCHLVQIHVLAQVCIDFVCKQDAQVVSSAKAFSLVLCGSSGLLTMYAF